MILIVGIPSEQPVALAIESAERRQISHLVLSQRRWDFCEFVLGVGQTGATGQLWFNDRAWPLENFTGIYARTMDPYTLPENHTRGGLSPDARMVARRAFVHELFSDWLEISPQRVVNRPVAMASNASKPYQAQLIVKSGFATPPTLITNDPVSVREFQARYGRVIYKSISSVRSVVKELQPNPGDLDKVRLLPTQFQAFIPGTNIRVHVVGTRVFATKIDSEAVDYRYGGREGIEAHLSAMTLPPQIEERCISLTAALGLAFAGIDLKCTPDGDWYCFEVNTAPGYSYFQQCSDQPIADALIDYLVGEGT